jgi:hypothetical protein
MKQSDLGKSLDPIVQDGDTAVCGGDRGEPGRGPAALEEGDQGDHRCGEQNLTSNSWTKSRQKSWKFSSLLFTVTSKALP